MKKILIAILIIASASAVQAQNLSSGYKTAIGAKVYFQDGTDGGINIKHFLNASNALEGTLIFSRHAIGIEGLYEWHGPITGAPGLKWYAGAGGLIGFYTKKHYDDDVYFALRGAFGLDYKIKGAPINLAFDLNPSFILSPDTDFNFGAGLAMRFAL